MVLDNGGFAFPGEHSPDAEAIRVLRDTTGIGIYEAKNMLSKHGGMTLRDWFAGQALSGLLSANAIYSGQTDNYVAIATDAFAHADAMIVERSK